MAIGKRGAGRGTPADDGGAGLGGGVGAGAGTASNAERRGIDFSIPPGCASSADTYSISPNEPIPDAGVITSTISVGGIGSFLWEMTVTTTITHTWNQDLDIYLISPAGSRVTLTTDNGGALVGVFHGTTWDDKAGETNPPGPVTLVNYSDNVPETPVSPEEPLGAFRGENPNGTWILEVQDDEAGLSGTLVRWGLTLVTLADTPDILTSSGGGVNSYNIPADGTPLSVPFVIDEQYASLAALELYTYITHPRSNDLVIELVPPSGQVITLAKEVGGPNTNVFNGTQWLDKAGASNPPGAVTDNDFFSGTVESPLAPQEPLGAASGTQIGGTWALRVADTSTDAITGTLNLFALNTTSYICAPDLLVYVSDPYVARMDEPVPVFVKTTNQGAPTTAPVYLTVTLPISGSFLSADGPSWDCSGTAVGALGGTVLCDRSGLAANTASTVTVQLSPPSAPQYLGELEAAVATLGDPGAPVTDSDGVFAGAHSANNNFWDVDDNQLYVGDLGGGGVDDGGQNTFDTWGELRLRVFNAGGSLLQETDSLGNFGLVYGPAYHWRTTTPVVTDTISVARSLYAPPDTDWLRYVDTFTNTGGASRTVWVAWGGMLSSGGAGETAGTSSGDAFLTAADTWAVTIEPDGPAAYTPPVGYAWRSPADTTYQGPGIYSNSPFTDTWPSSGEDELGHIFKLVLAPGASASLAYFVYRGLSESETGPADCEFYGDCLPEPAAGSQIALAETTAAALVLQPNFCDLSPAEFSKIVNWPGKAACAPYYLYLPLLTR